MQRISDKKQYFEKVDAPRMTRSQIMASVPQKDTTPEMAVRRYLHSRGLRYRLHHKLLPGRPDIVLARFRTVVFVHGCFWHRHSGCRRTTSPKNRAGFWEEKFQRNMERDAAKERELRNMGWRPLVIWECETKDKSALKSLFEEIVSGGFNGAFR